MLSSCPAYNGAKTLEVTYVLMTARFTVLFYSNVLVADLWWKS